jgi:GNAT superfamily N-acetyltransferase
MEVKEIIEIGMPLTQWTHKGCRAVFATASDWATLYHIETDPLERGKGLATQLLTEAKKYYEGKGKKFGGTVALNDTMADIYKRLEIEEYK